MTQAERLNGCLRSLDGLSVGDAFGQCFFSVFNHLPREGERRDMPAPPWMWTDDTAMACGIVEVLQRRGEIDQDDLAMTFAKRYMLAPDRGYGGGAKRLLTEIYSGTPWRDASKALFNGGSMGNGSAMRIAPLGAYFADDIPRVIDEARKSAEVTHAHPEGIAGAIAIALAAAFASNHAGQHSPKLIRDFFDFVLEHTPSSMTRENIDRAADLPRTSALEQAVRTLGNGSEITCPDTVPLCLWLAARHWTSYTDALWTTARAIGDIDTNCAIVGGIVALSDPTPIPLDWLEARGPIPSNADRT
jgi:ADP-ribosylglycohydrolase